MENKLNEAQVEIVINSLLETSGDDEAVKKAACESLLKLAKLQPNLIIKRTLSFRRKYGQQRSTSIIHLLELLEQICQTHLEVLDPSLVKQLINFAFSEMLKNTSYSSFPAVPILNAICSKYCRDVMDSLLSKLLPGAVPHQSIIYAIGSIACNNHPDFVVYVNPIFINIRPIIPAIKNEYQRQIIAITIEKICESILEVQPEKNAKISLVTSECAEIIHAIYDAFITQWAVSKDIKTVEVVLVAIGPMFCLLEENRLVEQTPRTVNTLLNLYKRSPHPPRHKISETLSTVLRIAPPVPLEPMLDNIIHCLHSMVWVMPDYEEPVTVKNHGEVLRCYDCIGFHFPDRLCELLLRQVRGGNESERVAALVVIAHLLGSSDSILCTRMPDLITALYILSDASVKVKKALIKTIVVLACKEFLSSSDEIFIEFLIKHCCPMVSCSGPEWVELREMCSSTITLLCTTVQTAFPLCWKVLLRLLLAPEYTAAVVDITKALSRIADKVSLDASHKEKFAPGNNQAVLSRCVALLGRPVDLNRGTSVLNFLIRYSSLISDEFSTLWKLKMPQLISYLELSECVENEWESLLLELLDETLHLSNPPDYALALLPQLTTQLSQYSAVGANEQRAMLLKCMAIALNHLSDTGIINAHLDVLFNPARGYNYNDSKICARAVSIISRKHTNIVFTYLKSIASTELTRKSSKLMGLMKDWKQEVESEHVRVTLFLCFGQLVLEAPAASVMPHLLDITDWLLKQLNATKDIGVYKAGFEAIVNFVDLFISAKKENEESLARDEALMAYSERFVPGVINLALSLLVSSSDPLFIKVLATLVKLPATMMAIMKSERARILKTCFGVVFNPNLTEVSRAALKNFSFLLEEMLINCPVPSFLTEIFSHLEPWLSHKSAYHRSAALFILRSILQCYQEHAKFSYEDAGKLAFSGMILGRVCYRSCETDLSIYTVALDCARIILVACARFEGHVGSNDSALPEVFSNLKAFSPPDLNITSNSLAKVICSNLPHNHLSDLVLSLISGLFDCEFLSSLGASLILLQVLSQKGAELYLKASEIFDDLLSAIVKLTPGEVRAGAINAVLEFGHHHPKILVSTLLKEPLPLLSGISEVWKQIGAHPLLSTEAIDQLVRVLSSTPLYEESSKHERDKVKIAVLAPLAVICALQELFSVASMGEIANARFSELFALILATLAAYVGILPPINSPNGGKMASFIPNRDVGKINPSKLALDTFKSLLLCSNCEAAFKYLEENSRPDLGESLQSVFLPWMPVLVRQICTAKSHLVSELIDAVSVFANSSCEPQRIVVTSFCAECFSACNAKTTGSVMTILLAALNDASPLVRSCALRGLGSSFDNNAFQMAKHGESVLSALTGGLDDAESNEYPDISCAALTGLTSVLPHLDSLLVTPVLVSLALRIKPFFEKNDTSVRSSAIRLFGELAKHYSSKESSQKNAFKEQVINSIVIFLLHLSEDEVPVVNACKYALYESCPLLSIGEMTCLVQSQLGKDSNYDHQSFFIQTTQILVKSMPESTPMFIMNALSYCKSIWPSIRASAALFIGLIFKCLDSNAAGKVSIDSVSAKLIMLLRDNDLNVRTQAATALGCLIYD